MRGLQQEGVAPYGASMTPRPHFFGYGSLVNRSTHDYVEAYPAKARGWRRTWCLTGHRDHAFLSVVRDAATTIEGLIAHVPSGDWAALDAREAGYARVRACDDVDHAIADRVEVAIYSVVPGRWPMKERMPILLSYLDVVVQGFLREFGEAGAQRFFETTDGWEVGIVNDRAAPLYPRHRALTDDERMFVDHAIGLRGMRVDAL